MGYTDAHHKKLIMACGLPKSSKCSLPLGLLDSQGSTYFVFLGENHHKISLIVCEGLILNEGISHLLLNTSYTALLSV